MDNRLEYLLDQFRRHVAGGTIVFGEVRVENNAKTFDGLRSIVSDETVTLTVRVIDRQIAFSSVDGYADGDVVTLNGERVVLREKRRARADD